MQAVKKARASLLSLTGVSSSTAGGKQAPLLPNEGGGEASEAGPKAVSPKELASFAISPRTRSKLLQLASRAKHGVNQRFQEGTRKTKLHYWMILLATAVLSSGVSFSIDQATAHIGGLRSKFAIDLDTNKALGKTILFNIGCIVLARLLCRTTVEAEGSGFPEVKAMLFGKIMLPFLTFRVLVVKACALTLGVGSGLPFGKEGPNVHMAACISRVLGPRFYEKRKGRASVDCVHLLLAACAVGVGSSFSAPIGGMVFALELVLPQVFDYVGYTGCFLSAVTGSICFELYRTWTADTNVAFLALMSSNVRGDEGALSNFPLEMLALDVLLGLICGILGGVWIKMHAKVVGAMKRWRTAAAAPDALSRRISDGQFGEEAPSRTRKVMRAVSNIPRRACSCCQCRDFLQMALVVTVNTLLQHSLPLIDGKTQPVLMSTLFDKELHMDQSAWSIDSLGPLSTMLACFAVKWFMTIFALSLPTPAGVVAPTMIIGALIGHCFAMLIPPWLQDGLLMAATGSQTITETDRGAFMARCAIVGAAAFCSAVCRAFAMAITVFEVLSLASALLPVSIASLTAIFVANAISLPFFDTNLKGRGLGGISDLTHTKKAMEPAFTVMRRMDVLAECLEQRTTIGTMRTILEQSQDDHVPIVQQAVHHWADEAVTAVLKGSMSRDNLHKLLTQYDGCADHKEVDLGSPDLARPADHSAPLIECIPTNVHPDTHVQDVYLIMKITGEQCVYVTENNCLLGIIRFKELLGHQL